MNYRSTCRYKAIKFPEGNRGENLGDFGFSHEFLDTAPEAQTMKEMIYSRL